MDGVGVVIVFITLVTTPLEALLFYAVLLSLADQRLKFSRALTTAAVLQNRRSFPIRKKHAEMGQAPTSQARPRDTDHLRP